MLFGIAYRMLGSVADAEDILQEAWIRWNAVSEPVAAPSSYLARIVTNLSLNRLDSAAVRRESYPGPWLPEPMVTVPDAAEEAERADEVSWALLVVLETLGPLERAVFVLREAFGYPHAEIARMLGRSEAAVRQVARRARAHVEARRPRRETDPAERRRVTEEFLAACLGGDMDAMLRMLAPDVTLWSDGGGRKSAALRPIHGADRVARWLLGVARREADAAVHPVLVGGRPGLLMTISGEVDTVAAMEVEEGRITALHLLRNPEKLRHVARTPW
ncbi:RNA polymerase sigma-70 factor [Streptomyces alkaliphilus]|uniref:RNA polymerase sigma-70 factor n=1 Tax=Streptomyces alkaliphilus TaxID=1472722 RepID=UPI0011817143|nr:RNA polymerase sigma-70 factor [Streptomyces alkaliphilus]MQS06015.1 RNA polymerase sigma-70 factor [Streptomyces alkaliphilus]